jgi:hypothetical protein
MEGSEQPGQERRQLTEDEARAAIEEQLAQVKVQDLLLESVVGILNLTARRIAKPDEQDLEQGKLGIDAVRAVVEFLPAEPQKAIRDALAELQMLYAREASGGGDAGTGGEPSSGPAEEPPPRRGPEPPPRLWTPGS